MWERKETKNDNIVEIDSQLYERVAILGMRTGRDDVTEFIYDMLECGCEDFFLIP